jgi:hypothetical protein
VLALDVSNYDGMRHHGWSCAASVRRTYSPADMQLIAEAHDLFRAGLGAPETEIAGILTPAVLVVLNQMEILGRLLPVKMEAAGGPT